MARTKRWTKHIACLETSLWDEKRDFNVATRCQAFDQRPRVEKRDNTEAIHGIRPP